MSFMRNLLLNAFGRPRGMLGRLGGVIMARANADFGIRVAGLLEIGPEDCVLEVGFGPGVVIEHLSKRAGRIAGVDLSWEMLAQARRRNTAAIDSGKVELHQGSAENLPFGNGSFDKALSINSMQVWSDAAAGLREIRRVLKPGGRIALGFTPRSGQSREEPAEALGATGFTDTRIVDLEGGFCALATSPG
jgi:ubiquinone/menaquinone biosynthesis C-methylase UbiE